MPKNKSDTKNSRIASQKTLKYINPKRANIIDTQNGKNNIESKIKIDIKILNVISLYYTEYA